MKKTILIVLLLTSQIVHSQTTSKKKINNPVAIANPQTEIKPPFIGTRYFVTDKGSTGRGTPHYFMRIEKNGNVYIGFEQRNSDTRETTEEEVFCGKFQTYLTVTFKKWGYDKHYYKIIGNKIYEVDSSKKVIKSNSCCYNNESDDNIPNNKECDCFGEFSE